MMKFPILVVIIFMILCHMYHLQLVYASLPRRVSIQEIPTLCPTVNPIANITFHPMYIRNVPNDSQNKEEYHIPTYHKKRFSLYYRLQRRKSL